MQVHMYTRSYNALLMCTHTTQNQDWSIYLSSVLYLWEIHDENRNKYH